MKTVTLNLSGGAIRFAGLIGACKAIVDSGFTIKIINGTSAGAIATLPVAMGMFDIAKKIGTSVKIKDLFDVYPFNSYNNNLSIKALIRAITGKPAFGKQNVTKLIKNYITSDVFYEYKENNEYPICNINVVNCNNGNHEIFNIKTLDYKTYLQVVEASCAIPLITEPVEITGYGHYYDGGLRNFIFNESKATTDWTISIYTRNSNLNLKPISNIFSEFERTLAILNAELIENDIFKEKVTTKNNLVQIFLPDILMHRYDDNTNRLSKLYDLSYNKTKIELINATDSFN